MSHKAGIDIIISSYPVYGKRTVSVPEPEYSVQGYASATMAYAAAHKIPKYGI